MDTYSCDHDSPCIGAHCSHCHAELCEQCDGCNCAGRGHTCAAGGDR
ncbi:hypothetical protein ACGFZP_12900 [Kitasatospora sp. NPDC048239]